ncbi:hypothetical protein [Streptomyces bottropensis]|uniref:hypothetical protein n=1 Tax=Streptomyces bottropensis TaxID=42235 RepID=UPI0036912DEC
MDSAAAFLTAIVATAVGGITGAVTTRRRAASPPPLDTTALREERERWTSTFVEFSGHAQEIVNIADIWPALPLTARERRLEEARRLLGQLKAGRSGVVLGATAPVREAAEQLIASAERMVSGFDLDQAPGPLRAAGNAAIRAFLEAGRDFLDAKENEFFKLPPRRLRLHRRAA